MLTNYFISEEEANIALSQFTDEYINENSIQYVSVLKKIFGCFSGYNYYLEVGVLQQIQKTNNNDKLDKEKSIPTVFEFKILKDNLQDLKQQQFVTKKIKVKENSTSKTSLDISNFDSDNSVSNDCLREFSSCGAIISLASFSGFFGITNGYVFHNDDEEILGQQVHYPIKFDANANGKVENSEIGYLSWASNTNLDVAIFKIEDEHKMKLLQSKGLQTLQITTTPKRGQLVHKNTVSGLASARIRSTNCSIKVWMPNGTVNVFRNQLQIHRLTSAGDSGAILYKKNMAVGLVFCSTNNYSTDNFSYANDITKIFNFKFNSAQKFYFNGKKFSVEQLILATGE